MNLQPMTRQHLEVQAVVVALLVNLELVVAK
jgi:hypothetical protein